MSDTISSTNMGMPVPVVGTAPGPDWAIDINSCLSILDSHDHSAGYGVQITPSGLDINSDLSFQINNLTLVRSLRFSPQSAPLALGTDIGCLYESVNDLYYNDGVGNQVRITQSGAVAGTPGSIGSLASPASATYVSGSTKFVWQSNTNTSADMDFGSAILRNNTVSSNGITLSAPAALGSNYTITLPALPASQKIMTLDSSGNLSAPYTVDNSTIEIAANVIKVKDSGIVTAKIADASVTIAKLAAMTTGTTVAAGGVAISTSSSTFSTTSATFVDVTNLSVTITTTGRPVMVMLLQDGGSSQAALTMARASGNTAVCEIKLFRDSTRIYFTNIELTTALATNATFTYPISTIQQLDVVAAGTYTYKMQVQVDTASTTLTVQYAKLYAYEI